MRKSRPPTKRGVSMSEDKENEGGRRKRRPNIMTDDEEVDVQPKRTRKDIAEAQAEAPEAEVPAQAEEPAEVPDAPEAPATGSRKRTRSDRKAEEQIAAQIEEEVSEDEEAEHSDATSDSEENHAGKILYMKLTNFMCHDCLEVTFNRYINFITGRNGSGKSAILTALTVGLGARANVTNRGTAIKDFVKKGKSSATVEITISNEGPSAYKPEIYGDTIKVFRSFGPSSSSYRIKASNGCTISTKKDELSRITSTLNIQVDNPISILNQDASRTFLTNSKPHEKYSLFMKATRMDSIGENYAGSEMDCDDSEKNLKTNRDRLNKIEAECVRLTSVISILNNLDKERERCDGLENQWNWAKVKEEEAKLEKLKKSVESRQNQLDKVVKEEENKVEKRKEVNEQITKLEEEIQTIQDAATTDAEKFEDMKKQLSEDKRMHDEKKEAHRKVKNQIVRIARDVKLLKAEIEKLKKSNEANDKAKMKEQVEKLEKQLNDVHDMLNVKQTELANAEKNVNHLEGDESQAQISWNQQTCKLRSTRQELETLSRQPDSAFSIYGHRVPTLMRKIDEEFQRGRFTKKPLGPIGSFIKVRDQTWLGTVETILGRSLLESFCVDNQQDAQTLNMLMKQIYRNESPPQIITSRFRTERHNVSRSCVQSSEFTSLLDMLEISDNIIANFVIDQKEPENTLLLPTSDDAYACMSEVRAVPHNCHRAYTLRGDQYLPAPLYRTYAGHAARPRFLQVSTGERIQSLREEVASLEARCVAEEEALHAIRAKRAASQKDKSTIAIEVSKLRKVQHSLQPRIDELKDKIEDEETTNLVSFVTDLQEKEATLLPLREEEKNKAAEVTEAETKVAETEKQMKDLKTVVDMVDINVSNVREKINLCKRELSRMSRDEDNAKNRLAEAKRHLQEITAKADLQERVTEQARTDAEAICPRVDAPKSAEHYREKADEVRANIEQTESSYPSLEELQRELEEKKQEHQNKNGEIWETEESTKEQKIRILSREKNFEKLKRYTAVKVKSAFKGVLRMRHYTGDIKINHREQTLDLEVRPISDARRPTNDTRTLSGGERSYSMVAFILALWECAGLPFYFLDEFDVFMDKVNRRVIMDILIEHAQNHPQHQYTFLTPLGMDNIKETERLKIFQLAPPERGD